jgi:hypothetical protein
LSTSTSTAARRRLLLAAAALRCEPDNDGRPLVLCRRSEEADGRDGLQVVLGGIRARCARGGKHTRKSAAVPLLPLLLLPLITTVRT